MQNNKTNLSYLYTYVNDIDLVSPSKKNRINLFIDTYKDNPVKYGEYLKSLDKELDNLKNTSNDELGKHLDETEFKPKDISKASDKDLKKAYRMFTSASGYKDHSNDDMIKAYYEKVKQKGYNSIIDDNDSGNYYFVTNPIISLNSSKTLKEISKEKWDTETAKAYADAVNDELSYYLQYL